MAKTYSLPKLPYGYKALEPYISEKQLRIHHDKHHAGYVKGANSILDSLVKARKAKKDIDMKAALKALSFNIGGHILHSLFWPNLAPKGKGGKPSKALADAIDREFGSMKRFKEEFKKACGVEGSGWVALAYCRKTERLMLMQIEKHNTNVFPIFPIIMVLDLWEHAFYLDYQNEKGKFIDAFWNIVNWKEISRRFEDLK